jgi:hypothetical protein
MEKENRGSAWNAASNIPHIITGCTSYRSKPVAYYSKKLANID